MWRTRVGYAGGTTADPTYRNIGDHTECFQVDFDPTAIAYGELLELFWQSHDPTRRPHSTQYASLVLAHDRAQLAEARASAARLESIVGRKVLTRIELLDRFYVAEEYHQKYYLRQNPALAREFAAKLAGDEAAFRESPATAKANARAAGLGGAGCRVR